MPKILIVEDEKETLKCIGLTLKQAGFEVSLAPTGQEALKLNPQEAPDIVLIDLGLPDMDGREVLKEIKSKAPNTKVVIFSGYSESETRKELLSLGADYFLNKPIIPTKLKSFLNEVFSKKQ